MQTLFTPNIIHTKCAEPSKINEKWLGKKVKFFPRNRKNKKENLLIFGKDQIYFISCVENINNFTRATHSWNYWYFQHMRWNIFGSHLKKVNILYVFVVLLVVLFCFCNYFLFGFLGVMQNLIVSRSNLEWFVFNHYQAGHVSPVLPCLFLSGFAW